MGLRARAIVGKKYELVSPLGHGGMGEIWKVRYRGEEFALKLILPGLKDDESIVDRFKNEIHAAMVLRNPHVVSAKDFGWDPEHGPYLVMDHLVGKTFRTVLADGPIRDVSLAVEYLLQAVDAVSAAHALGIVHRDLKPENLFLTEAGGRPVVKVLDFGIARLKDGLNHLTQVGSFLGTKNYSSPEQFQNSVEVTERSDIWSLGAILYEFLCGAKAFPGEDMAPVATILTSSPLALSSLRRELPPGLVAVVERCLHRNPERRFSSADALRDALVPFSSSATADDFGDAATELALEPATARTGVAVRPVLHVGAPLSRRGGTRYPELGAMIDAICNGRRRDGSARRVVFMLGAGFSLDAIPKTEEFVELIHAELPKSDRSALRNLQHKSKNLYQDAFRLLRSRKSSYEANKVVRTAVLRAYRGHVELRGSEAEQARQCEKLEEQHNLWTLPDGVEYLGEIIRAGLWRADANELQPGTVDWRFSAIHLTTNFDPLLAIGVRRLGGTVVPYSVAKDGKLPKTTKQSCAIVHLHGRWDEGDTLHVDLDVPRPQLQDSLHELLNGSTLVVVGYGGWDDVFMRTLETVAARDNDFEVLWGFYDLDQKRLEEQNGELIRKLTNALAPHIEFYRGIDANSLFRDLRAKVLDPTVMPPSLPRPRDTPDITPPPPPPSIPTPPPKTRRKHPVAAALGALGLLALAALIVVLTNQKPTASSENPPETVRAAGGLAARVSELSSVSKKIDTVKNLFDVDFKPCLKSQGCNRPPACLGPNCVKTPSIVCSYRGAAEPTLAKAFQTICRDQRPKRPGKVRTKDGVSCDCKGK